MSSSSGRPWAWRSGRASLTDPPKGGDPRGAADHVASGGKVDSRSIVPGCQTLAAPHLTGIPTVGDVLLPAGRDRPGANAGTRPPGRLPGGVKVAVAGVAVVTVTSVPLSQRHETPLIGHT